MVSDPLPQEVAALLEAHVESYEQLAMLLLVQSEPTRLWSVADLAASLRIAAHAAEDIAIGLSAWGVLGVTAADPDRHYRYAATGKMAAVIAQLAAEYTQNPLGVVKALSANAIKRVRTSALRAFADAFVVKKKERDDG